MNIDYNNNFNDNNFSFDDSRNCNTELNCSITTEEVVLATKSPKNKKSCGPDDITNEMLKIVCSLNLGFLTELFNIILKSGIYPSPWRENYFKPIFKGGCFSDRSNYRGISLSSCLGKLYFKNHL
jgi:hypothetical protein